MMLPNNSRSTVEEIAKQVDYLSILTERYVELKTVRACKWEDMRKDEKSDASTERKWERTEEGIEQMVIKYKRQSIKEKIATLRDWSFVLSLESRNQQ